MASKKDEFGPEETRKRMEAALRGARIAGPKHRESVTPKRKGAQRGRKKPNSP